MSKRQKFYLKIGDKVKIIAGSYKNEIGEILSISKKTNKLLIKGINFKYKHIKPKTKNEIGEIKKIEAPIHYSNVKLNLK